jgi:hypothetical protein
VTDFVEFPKIARLKRGCVITEKIDGTNAQVHVLEDGQVLAGSRNRYVTPDNDNFGFAAWVRDHTEELRQLGPGRHFGEWWGSGIQRHYDMKEKVFSLFNTGRWPEKAPPPCCRVVPVLYSGPFSTERVGTEIELLRAFGSVASPGFAKPEGVVIFLPAAQSLFKVTLEKDEEPKGVRR